MASRMNIRRQAKKDADPSEEPKTIFIVLKQTASDGKGKEKGVVSKVSVRGVHSTEEQAYSAAIAELVYDLEQAERTMLPKVREIGKSKTLPLKDRLKSVQSCQDSEERVEFLIKKSLAFPELKELDSENFLNAPFLPCAYWDSSDEENYNPDDDEEEDDDDDDDDEEDDEDADMADLVNEEELFQGIEGSGTKEEKKE